MDKDPIQDKTNVQEADDKKIRRGKRGSKNGYQKLCDKIETIYNKNSRKLTEIKQQHYVDKSQLKNNKLKKIKDKLSSNNNENFSYSEKNKTSNNFKKKVIFVYLKK